MKVYLETLGCKLNESELETWARQFAHAGHELVSDPRLADICVLNTCTVTHTAAHKSRQIARQLARANPAARLVLTGCFASLSPEQAKELPNVALLVPNTDKDRLAALAGGLIDDARYQMTETGCRMPEAASGLLPSVETPPPLHSPSAIAEWHPETGQAVLRTRAFVKVMDGCNMSCSYCIIPLARGKEQSRPLPEVVAEVRSLVEAGYQEIILTGVQISVYRDESSGATLSTLRDLVDAILTETSVPRLRLTSIAPWDLDRALLDQWRDPRLCRHLHLSLQSGADTVLRRMRRAYTTAQFARVADLARECIPDLGITTDVIVGFPGESDVEFDQSADFVRTMQFARVHVFPYSAREGTVAARLPLQVAGPVKAARAKVMQAIASASAGAFARRFVGRDMTVLWEALQEGSAGSERSPRSEDGLRRIWSGYTDNYIRVTAASEQDLRNRLTGVHLLEADSDGVRGLISDMERRA